jgi:hypothetical protein
MCVYAVFFVVARLLFWVTELMWLCGMFRQSTSQPDMDVSHGPRLRRASPNTIKNETIPLWSWGSLGPLIETHYIKLARKL